MLGIIFNKDKSATTVILLTNCHNLYPPPHLHFYNLHWNCQFLREWVVFFFRKVIGTSRLLESQNFHTSFCIISQFFGSKMEKKGRFYLLQKLCVLLIHVLRENIRTWQWYYWEFPFGIVYHKVHKHTYSLIRLMYYICIQFLNGT